MSLGVASGPGCSKGEAEGWNFAYVWEWIAECVPTSPALIHGDSTLSWQQFDQSANGIAHALLEVGLKHQDKVALLLYNDPAYLQCIYGITKASLVPVATNRRYVEDELVQLWDHVDVSAVIFHSSLAELVTTVRSRLSRIRHWYCVEDDEPCPPWARRFSDIPSRDILATPSWHRSGQDILIQHTGGSTGRPKAVVWKQCDLYNSFSSMIWRDPLVASKTAVQSRVLKRERHPIALSASPLFHGTGQFVAMEELCLGGSVVTLTSRSFDPTEVLDTIDRKMVSVVAIVGDAFGRPIYEELARRRDHWDLKSLKLLISSGAILSERTKNNLLKQIPWMKIGDSLCATEAMFVARSASSVGSDVRTGTFRPGPTTRVIGHDGVDVLPGSGRPGRLAVGGFQSSGFYKDPDLYESATQVIGNERYLLSGDYAQVNLDGTITLVGRGSTCINSAGEQVFPMEVEKVLNTHPAVMDSAVVGLPHGVLGEKVVALVELEEKMGVIVPHLISYVKARLASYKAPREVFIVDRIDRMPNGKIDYARMRQMAIDRETDPVSSLL